VANFPPRNEDEWGDALARLTLHAHHKMAGLYWRGVRMVCGDKSTGIVEPADFAAEAIKDAIAGKRKWNPDKDFLEFLKGVVDSKVNHLVTSVEGQKTRRLLPPVEGKDPMESMQALDLDGGNPQTIVAEKEVAERFRGLVLAEIKGDELVERLFECLDAEIEKPAEIADLLGVAVQEIYNAQKRLATKAEKALQKHRKGSK